MLLWGEEEIVQIRSSSEGYIDATIKNEEGWWRFTGFYGNPKTHKRKFSWDLLDRLGQSANLLWLIGGDFNEILAANEKQGG